MSVVFFDQGIVPDNNVIESCVIFIHGIGGDSEKTWQADVDDRDSIWMRWLSADFPNSLIVSVNYGDSITGESMPIFERAHQIAISLRDHAKLGNVPYVFVCHSMGGLIAKQIALFAAWNDSAEWRELSQNYRGAFFFGTPHNGSRLAGFAAKYVLGKLTSPSLKDLPSYNSYAQFLSYAYASYARSSGELTHRNLYETKKTNFFMVVDRDSAKIEINGVENEGADDNHITIAKFETSDAENYKKVKSFIRTAFNSISLKESDETHSYSANRGRFEPKSLTKAQFALFSLGNFFAITLPWAFFATVPSFMRGKVPEGFDFIESFPVVSLSIFTILSIFSFTVTGLTAKFNIFATMFVICATSVTILTLAHLWSG